MNINENLEERNQEMEVDVQRLLGETWRKKWLILTVAVICAAAMLVATMLFITPKYQSSAMFYVNNSSISVGDTSLKISNGDLVTSRGLVESYLVILNTRETLVEVIDYADVNYSYSALKSMISAAAVNETEIFKVTVTSPDPNEAEKIANAIAYILPKRISNIIEGTSAKIVDTAVVPSAPSSPSYTKNAMLGFLAGFVLSAGVIVLLELFDTTIRTDEDVAQSCKYPLLAAVPDMTASSKGGYDYTYDRKKTDDKKGSHSGRGQGPVLIGGNISFAAAEAYKLLRTKLQFSFTDNSSSHVIGLTSALSGEGKSLSAVNLAYSLSQLHKKVILIDCDMRRPTLAEKLKIQKKPGLSSFLTGQSDLESLIQFCCIKNDEKAFHVVAAGQNPPNPIELLSSDKMVQMLERLRKSYDFIILDMPPISEVSDAMAVANEVDGMLLVVRQNYCDRMVLSDTVRQLEFVGAKILGVIYNCTVEGSGRYGQGYYKRYNKYGRRYYSRYYRHYYAKSRYSYAAARDTVEEKK